MWIAEIADREALVRLIRTALLREVASVHLTDPHITGGIHVLQIRLRGEAVCVLGAELAGTTRTGSFLLHLTPLDPSHEPELVELVELARADDPKPASEATSVLSTSGSAIFAKEPPLDEPPKATPMQRYTKTMPEPEPEPLPLPSSLLAPTERQRSAADFDTAEMKARPRLDETWESDPPNTSPRDPELPTSLRGPRTVKRSYNLSPIIVGRVIAGRYRIESLVGAGGTGVVYKASHVDLPRTIAIKVLHPHFRTDPHLMASFRTEARAASLLDHPNVAVVHDFGEEPDGLVYIVMEYIGGESLQAVLDRELRLTPRRAVDLMLQICAALSVAHDRGIVHRDVKPDNIMVVPSRDDEGRAFEHVKVCDFGIASLESTPDAKDEEWAAGTPEYMAPEQSAGRADQRTDVYACGIVLYEMITGRPPFLADSAIATLAKHATEIATRPSELVPGVPPALEAVIFRAIEKSPDRRFATVRELRAILKHVL